MSRELPRLDIRRVCACVWQMLSPEQIKFNSSARPFSTHIDPKPPSIVTQYRRPYAKESALIASPAVFHSSGISSCFARVSGWCKTLITQLPEAPSQSPVGGDTSPSSSLCLGCHSLGHVQLMLHRLSISWQTLLLLLRSSSPLAVLEGCSRSWKGVEIVDLLQIQHQEEIYVCMVSFTGKVLANEPTKHALLIHWIPRGKEGFALVRMLDISV